MIQKLTVILSPHSMRALCLKQLLSGASLVFVCSRVLYLIILPQLKEMPVKQKLWTVCRCECGLKKRLLFPFVVNWGAHSSCFMWKSNNRENNSNFYSQKVLTETVSLSTRINTQVCLIQLTDLIQRSLVCEDLYLMNFTHCVTDVQAVKYSAVIEETNTIRHGSSLNELCQMNNQWLKGCRKQLFKLCPWLSTGGWAGLCSCCKSGFCIHNLRRRQSRSGREARRAASFHPKHAHRWTQHLLSLTFFFPTPAAARNTEWWNRFLFLALGWLSSRAHSRQIKGNPNTSAVIVRLSWHGWLPADFTLVNCGMN